MGEKLFPYTNREEAKEYALKALSDLTPGGSEFFEAPKNCEDYIRRTVDDLQEGFKRAVLARKRIRRETIEECAKACRDLPGTQPTLGTILDSIENQTKNRCAAAVFALAEDQP